MEPIIVSMCLQEIIYQETKALYQQVLKQTHFTAKHLGREAAKKEIFIPTVAVDDPYFIMLQATSGISLRSATGYSYSEEALEKYPNLDDEAWNYDGTEGYKQHDGKDLQQYDNVSKNGIDVIGMQIQIEKDEIQYLYVRDLRLSMLAH